MDSVFTKIINGKSPAFRLWENDLFIAILDIHPINPGHTLLIPKQQIDDIFDLPDELYNSMWQTVKWLAPHIQQAMESKRIGIAVEGFSVPHVHIHLVPVNSNNELNPERSVSASPEQLSIVQNKICQVINT
ncbi:HIT family protein [Pleurocapsa sp. PCC 7319]|uniref:HIT family protein n=1 Tax=Pleurocapsa sp. PCC 7319 TaxID=118161 RepID=UPI000347808A|nr:HIT family protein [Pleurocapsa sp. PCC 7319]